MNAILSITLFVLAGMVLGAVFRKQLLFLRIAGRASSWAVYPLLFLLGAGLGADRELLARLPALGGKAACISVCTVLGSALCLRWLEKYLGIAARPQGRAEASASAAHKTAPQSPPSPLWGTAGILLAFAAGIFCSHAGWLSPWLYEGPLVLYALWLLVFAIGVCLGGDPGTIRIVRAMGLRILLVPVCTVAGTFFGSAVAAVILPDLVLRDTLAVGAGFGYYSLSSLIIDQMGNPPLAAVALLSNLFRELLGPLTAPFLVRFFGPLAPVGAAGATAMDTCLPIIARFSGEHCAIIAVCSGMVLTLLTPFCVTFIMAW